MATVTSTNTYFDQEVIVNGGQGAREAKLVVSGLTANAANFILHGLPKTPRSVVPTAGALGLWGVTQDPDAALSFTFTAATVGSFVLASVVGATGVYTGTVTGGNSNAFAGRSFVVTGFAASAGANNGTYLCTASSATTLTLANGAAVDETHAGAAAFSPAAANYVGVFPEASRTVYTLTAVVGATGVYSGTITGGASNAYAGKWFTIYGFKATSGANNGTFLCTASSVTSLTLVNASAVNETLAGSAVSGTYIGHYFKVTGFTNSGNNGTFRVSDNTTTTLTLVNSGSVAETHAGAAVGGFVYISVGASGATAGTVYVEY